MNISEEFGRLQWGGGGWKRGGGGSWQGMETQRVEKYTGGGRRKGGKRDESQRGVNQEK